MAPRAKKAELKGSAKVKDLQEKQVVALDKSLKALSDNKDNLLKSIEEGLEQLNNLYYDIQAKEEEIARLDADATEARESADANAYQAREARVAELKANIKGLEKDYKTKYEDFEVSFNLQIRESKEQTLTVLLEEFDLAYISQEHLAEVKSDLSSIEERLTKKAANDKNASLAMQKRSHDATISELELKHKADIAELEATAKNAEKQVEFYKAEVTAAKESVQAILDNQARIAEAGQGIVVNTNSK